MKILSFIALDVLLIAAFAISYILVKRGRPVIEIKKIFNNFNLK